MGMSLADRGETWRSQDTDKSPESSASPLAGKCALVWLLTTKATPEIRK